MKRLKEPSTWAGLAALFQVGAALAPQYASVFHGATVLAGALAGVIAEGKGAPAAGA
jgi:hypothetical protein